MQFLLVNFTVVLFVILVVILAVILLVIKSTCIPTLDFLVVLYRRLQKAIADVVHKGAPGAPHMANALKSDPRVSRKRRLGTRRLLYRKTAFLRYAPKLDGFLVTYTILSPCWGEIRTGVRTIWLDFSVLVTNIPTGERNWPQRHTHKSTLTRRNRGLI